MIDVVRFYLIIRMLYIDAADVMCVYCVTDRECSCYMPWTVFLNTSVLLLTVVFGDDRMPG